MQLHYSTLLREKCPYSELFWRAFSRIRTEYGQILRISHIQSECGKLRIRITPNTDTFHVVHCICELPIAFISRASI